MTDSEYLSPGEAADLLGVSTRTLTRWADEGHVQAIRVGPNGHRRYTRASVLALSTPTLHTGQDLVALIAAGVDPESTQPRERSVPCNVCGTPTRNQAGGCDRHYTPPASTRRVAS